MEKPAQFRTSFSGFHREDVVHYLEFLNNKHNTELSQLHSEINTLRKKVNSPAEAEECARLRRSLDAAEAELEELRDRSADDQEKVDEARRQLREMTARCDSLEQAAAVQKSEDKPESAAYESLKRDLEQTRAELETMKSRAEIMTRQDMDLAQCREKLARLTVENEELRKKNAVLEAKLTDAEAAAAAREKAGADSELEAYRRAERVERVARENAYKIASRLRENIEQASAGPVSEAGGLIGIVERIAAEMEALCGAADRLQAAYTSAASAAEALDKELHQ